MRKHRGVKNLQDVTKLTILDSKIIPGWNSLSPSTSFTVFCSLAPGSSLLTLGSKLINTYTVSSTARPHTHKKKLHSANRNWLCDPKNQQISQISAPTKYLLHNFKKLVRVKVIKMSYGSQLKISLVLLLRDNLNRNYFPAFCCAQNKTHPEVLSISYMSTGSSIPASKI